MLPSNNLRSKLVKINSKEIKISPWKNLTLTEFEDIYVEDNKFNTIEKYLITPFIEYNGKLTLQEKRYILIQLYILSNGNNLDIQYNCKHCNTPSSYSLDIDKSIKLKELETRIIKTKNYIFNLRNNSNYSINLKEDINYETLKYIASFINTVEDSSDEYSEPDIEKMANWINSSLPKEDFDSLCEEFFKIQPDLDIKCKAVCENCFQESDLDFKGIENFLK